MDSQGPRHLTRSSIRAVVPGPGGALCPLHTLPPPLADSQRHRVMEEEAQQSRFQMPPLEEGESV